MGLSWFVASIQLPRLYNRQRHGSFCEEDTTKLVESSLASKWIFGARAQYSEGVGRAWAHPSTAFWNVLFQFQADRPSCSLLLPCTMAFLRILTNSRIRLSFHFAGRKDSHGLTVLCIQLTCFPNWGDLPSEERGCELFIERNQALIAMQKKDRHWVNIELVTARGSISKKRQFWFGPRVTASAVPLDPPQKFLKFFVQIRDLQ